MSLFIEMFLLLVLAGLVGMFIGWAIHGKCDDDRFESTDKRGGV